MRHGHTYINYGWTTRWSSDWPITGVKIPPLPAVRDDRTGTPVEKRAERFILLADGATQAVLWILLLKLSDQAEEHAWHHQSVRASINGQMLSMEMLGRRKLKTYVSHCTPAGSTIHSFSLAFSICLPTYRNCYRKFCTIHFRCLIFVLHVYAATKITNSLLRIVFGISGFCFPFILYKATLQLFKVLTFLLAPHQCW